MKIFKKLVRIYVNDLEKAIIFYSNLTNKTVDMRFKMSLNNLEPSQVPTGKNMTVKHPDGLVAEYVEHS